LELDLAWPQAINDMYQFDFAQETQALVDDNPDNMVEDVKAPYNGLRVRIGIHYGAPQVIFDEAAKGFDYYGPDVNLAARVESVTEGGQILLSPAMHAALDGSIIEGGLLIPAGEAQLKGVTGKTELTELSVLECPGRKYKKLTARAANEADDAVSVASTTSVSIKPDQTLGAQIAEIFGERHPLVNGRGFAVDELQAIAKERYETICTLLKPYTKGKRKDTLQRLLDGWRIPSAKDEVRDTLNLVSRLLQAEKIANRAERAASFTRASFVHAPKAVDNQ